MLVRKRAIERRAVARRELSSSAPVEWDLQIRHDRFLIYAGSVVSSYLGTRQLNQRLSRK